MRWELIIPLIVLAALAIEQFCWWDRIIANDLGARSMSINDWWWTGVHNALDGHYSPPRVSFLKKLSYRFGWSVTNFLQGSRR